MSSSVRLSVIIPVFNEVRTVAQVVRRVQDVPVDKEIVLVDDGSSDGTRDILAGLEGQPGVRVVLHVQNRGKGAAIRTGLAHTRGEFVVVQDADLEYDPGEYPRLLEPLVADCVHAVYGSRFLGSPEKMTALHRFGNLFLSWLTNVLYGAGLTDMETCYKVIRGDIVRAIRIESDRFDFEPEITAKLLRLGHTIVEIPITYRGREFHEGKKITWRDGFGAIRALLRFRFRPIRTFLLAEAEAERRMPGAKVSEPAVTQVPARGDGGNQGLS
ncbi:MAG: glycosyltransferase family 2 protein [Candidatus Sericytochromatia bacterium]|uniref:Glycosyltransferase family 2 protein n=1 Tax=Candidatus Tanganyikabacteria bacterium TaxID=2961651 RepID=A0A937X560_9BACT|nr:glycosyltransferase family 2 protein [Candidatus Tanganyikabacteria bacterium]